MALDVSKLRQQEQVQATGNNPAASTSASSSSQPIDMKTGTMTPEEKQAKVLEFIKSGEFKKCPDDQKLELLKQQFPDLAGLPEKDLARYFAEAINTLPAEEPLHAALRHKAAARRGRRACGPCPDAVSQRRGGRRGGVRR